MAAESVRPDVVLLDIGLPKLNGYEVARKIREHAWGESMVLVALTGWGQDEDRRKSREAGFNHHFVKPGWIDGAAELFGKLRGVERPVRPVAFKRVVVFAIPASNARRRRERFVRTRVSPGRRPDFRSRPLVP